MKKEKIKILCTLGQNHYDSRKNDCSFFNSFFRSILTCSIVYFWYIIGTYSVFFLQLWVNRVVCFVVSVCFARFVSVDSSRAAASHRVVVEHSRSAEDETKCCHSSQDVSGNPPILCINQAITSRLTQAPGPPLSSRQHPVSPLSVSLDIFGCSVFRSCKFRRAPTWLQLRLEMKVGGHQLRIRLLLRN